MHTTLSNPVARCLKTPVVKLLAALLLLAGFRASGQVYTSYLTGDSADAIVTPSFGVLLAGGAGDSDPAMTWFLEKANGGDILVLRASGADGYNGYLFSDLGVTVNSVETIVCHTAASGNDPYVVERISEAEAIFFAGGDQADYLNFWKDKPAETALNNHINVKGGAVGGTSAGMAILGGHYFSADNGTVFSDEALANPYNNYMTLGHWDMLQVPYMHDVITDTHYNDPDRKGRHMAFLARIISDGYPQALGIACNEYVAVVFDEDGLAQAYGEYPDYDDHAWFLRHGCENPWTPEICMPAQPLTWERNQTALYVFRMDATTGADNSFDLSDWTSASGGNWQEWYVQAGILTTNEVSFGPQCPLNPVTGLSENIRENGWSIAPNPISDQLRITGHTGDLAVYDILGNRVMLSATPYAKGLVVDTSALAPGTYLACAPGKTPLIFVRQ